MDAKKQRFKSPSSPQPQHHLVQVLSCGVVGLLSGAEAACVLSTCREIRFDEAATSCALRSATNSPRWRCVDDHIIAGISTAAYPTMLQLVWCMDELLTTNKKATNEGTGAVQGFLLLAGADATTMDTTQAVVAKACRLAVTPARSSRFKAHWDHLTLSVDSRNTTAVCALCEAALASICSYREGTEYFANELEKKVQRAENQWEAEGRSASEIFELSYDLQQSCFESESFYDAYVANRNDESVLRHVVASGRFPVERPVGIPADLMAALNAARAMPVAKCSSRCDGC